MHLNFLNRALTFSASSLSVVSLVFAALAPSSQAEAAKLRGIHVAQSAATPSENADAKKDAKAGDKSGDKSADKAETKIEAKAETQAEIKSQPTAEQKPEAKAETKAPAEAAPKAVTTTPIQPTVQPTAPPAAAAASPAPVPAPAAPALALPASTPAQPLSRDESRAADKLAGELKRHCDRHFPGQIQGELRSACASAAGDFVRIGGNLAQTRCRVNFGEEPRLVMACQVGVAITDDMVAGREDFKKQLQHCAEYYPVYTEIDAFLQESCLTGMHLPRLTNGDNKPRYQSCAEVSPERSFIGPCTVGLSFAQEMRQDSKATPVAAHQQNRLCEKYFDHKKFHAGYRACLIARGLAPEMPDKARDAIASCTNVISDLNNDTERAACVVGVAMYRHLQRNDDIAKRFKKCGENKVRYADRDFLACLTAASLLDFGDKSGADGGCREIFKTNQTKGRLDCSNSLSLF